MRNISFIVCMIIGLSITSYAGNSKIISKITTGSRQDIFQIVSPSQVASGKALLNIDFPVKANKAYFFGSYIKHENPPYTIFINIDDQVAELRDEPVLETLAGHFTENPEAGKGWKYHFRKSILLMPGAHRISIAVPLADVVIEKEVVLKEGENLLQLVPTYNTSILRYPKHPRFTKGLHSIAIMLNGEIL